MKLLKAIGRALLAIGLFLIANVALCFIIFITNFHPNPIVVISVLLSILFVLLVIEYYYRNGNNHHDYLEDMRTERAELMDYYKSSVSQLNDKQSEIDKLKNENAMLNAIINDLQAVN